MGTVQYLGVFQRLGGGDTSPPPPQPLNDSWVEAIGKLPTALPQKWRFSHEKNRFLATVLRPFGLFLKQLYVVTLDWDIVRFFSFFLFYAIVWIRAFI